METIEIIKELREVLKEIFGMNIPDRVMAWIILIIVVIVIATFILVGIIKIFQFFNRLSQKPWRKKKIREILSPDYLDQLKEQKYFISTKFTTSPPHNLDDPMEVERTESAKNLIDHFLDKVLVEDNTTNRFFCILAGAGMGKTTWTVNLVTSYINKYKESTWPYDIVLVSLAHKDFAEKVQVVVNKSNTILILDALDENVEASNNLEKFMSNLEQIIQEFRFVILTSRTQFFPSEEAEPYRTSMIKLSGAKGNFVFHKMYISPFSKEDVTSYLKKKYPNWRMRKKAASIVQRCASLATRPLLLSHLDDILENDQEYLSLYDIYSALIEAWIKREVLFMKGEENAELSKKLYDFSLHFALELYSNREESTNMRMKREKYLEFIQDHGYTDYNFSGRSLINRDAEGTLKFSHKTFYEYFLAKAKFINPDLELPDSGYELAWTFYEQLVKSYLSKTASNMVMINDDTMLCSHRVGTFNFDYRWLNNVVKIKRAGVIASLLNNNTDNFTSWIQKSTVEIVDVIDYQNESLKKLLFLPKLKEVNILNSAKITTKGRQQIQKLAERGIQVSDTKWKLSFYGNAPYFYKRKEQNGTSLNSLILEGYLHFLRSQAELQSFEFYIKNNSGINISISTE